ncbi:hypothetical protein HCH06_17945 [Enterobacter ludwigii]|uniref:hypothetical protein n=1 Tax=Enterobacter ludwigii TaxID=299767 RepID=UPI001C8C97DB|nr:hypothetical protein [Enterobacter ludwigii]MBX9031245.1 hypothetical protein [Enterobacter ludwigii]
MSTIAREQLRERAREKVKSLEFAVTQAAFADSRAELEEELELARIALAAQAAGPVYQWRERYIDSDLWDDCTKEQYEGFAKHPDFETRILYTAPPAPVSVPTFEEWCKRTEQKPVGWVHDAMKEAYDACRAAMLQGAGGNSPVLPDGWVACCERMPKKGAGSTMHISVRELRNGSLRHRLHTGSAIFRYNGW